MDRETLGPPDFKEEVKKERKIFDIGKKVVVKRTSGKLEGGWVIVKKDKDRFCVEKKENNKILSKWVTEENLIDWQIADLEIQKEQIIAWGDITLKDRELIEKIEQGIEEWKRIKEEYKKS